MSDAGATVASWDDFPNTGGAPASYLYDAIGNLTSETEPNVTRNITWRANGKVNEVEDNSGQYPISTSFEYDGLGNRLLKRRSIGTSENKTDVYLTYYVRDASGNIMATYSKKYESDVSTGVEVKTTQDYLKLDELSIYGSNRLGIAGDTARQLKAMISRMSC